MDILNGILLINKPQSFTSFDVVAKLRGILKTKKIGHAGTLDPMATGVLPVFVGSATRACDILPDTDKSYRAVLRLGTVTDTQDIWGTVLSTTLQSVKADQFHMAAALFTGTIMQTPPMYSAVKIDGKRLYELARLGKEVERPARQVTVHCMRSRCIDEAAGEYELEVSCTKGTYIRTLCADIGDALGCGAVMTGLVRTSACGFMLEDCHTFEEIERCAADGRTPTLLIPTDRAFARLTPLALDEKNTMRFLNGAEVSIDREKNSQTMRVYATDGSFLGLGSAQDGLLRVQRFLGGAHLR